MGEAVPTRVKCLNMLPRVNMGCCAHGPLSPPSVDEGYLQIHSHRQWHRDTVDTHECASCPAPTSYPGEKWTRQQDILSYPSLLERKRTYGKTCSHSVFITQP
ncbi:hypothetical protein XELAEV_18020522mg [Xenopus laevis]|uniref:Uncharacterized protein n=1 Tax=Xenopus laevis TaxID=8355 RepID=A0A974D9U7_XENLA|nr:hypothetical protein XELAEV_18020522mg [Xenopus laevis]